MGETEKRERNKQFGDMIDPSIASQIVAEVRKANNCTMPQLIDLLKETYPNYDTSVANLANKLYRGTIRFYEVVAVLDALGYEFCLRKKPESDAEEENIVLHLNGIEKESDVSDSSDAQTGSNNRQDIEDIQDKVSSLSKSMDEITTRIGEIDRLLGIVSPDESETVYRLVPEHKVAFAPAVSTKEDGTSRIVYNTKLDKNRILSDIVAHLLEDAKIELVDPTENDSLVKRRFGKSIHIGSKTKK